MASYYYDYDYEIDGMTGVNKWKAADGFASYNSVSGGSDYSNSNDVGYELSPYETPTAGFFSPSTSAYHYEFDRGSEATWDFKIDRHNYKLNLDQPAPQFGTCQRPSRPAPYAPPHLRSYATQRQVLPSYHNTSYETYTTRMRQLPQALNSQGMNYYHGSVPNSDFEYWHDNHCDVSSTYSAAYNDDSSVRNSDTCDVMHDYWVPEITSMRNIEHEIDFRDVAPKEGVRIVAGIVSDVCLDSDIYHPPHNTVGPLDEYSTLELMLQENETMRQDLRSVMLRLDKLIEEEERKKLEASLPCLEKSLLESDVVVTEEQTPAEIEVNLVDDAIGMGDNKRLAGTDIELVVTSQEKVDKTEQSVGLRSAMRCLELQRKFWAIGSMMSVIPAVPLHQFIDPFFKGLESKQQLQHAIFGPFEENDIEAVRAQESLEMGCKYWPGTAWTELSRVKEEDMILKS